MTQIRWGGKWVHLAYIWIVSHLSTKNYQNWWKFDEVLTKTNLLSFFWDTVYFNERRIVQAIWAVNLCRLLEMAFTWTSGFRNFCSTLLLSSLHKFAVSVCEIMWWWWWWWWWWWCWCYTAEAAYDEQCRSLLEKKETMLTKYRQLLLLESMVWPTFMVVYLFMHWQNSVFKEQQMCLLLLFPFFHWLYLFSLFVHPFPFYQNSPTPFPGRRS